jgi:hypothetical protein
MLRFFGCCFYSVNTVSLHLFNPSRLQTSFGEVSAWYFAVKGDPVHKSVWLLRALLRVSMRDTGRDHTKDSQIGILYISVFPRVIYSLLQLLRQTLSRLSGSLTWSRVKTQHYQLSLTVKRDRPTDIVGQHLILDKIQNIYLTIFLSSSIII